MALTHEDLNILKRPLDVQEHHFLKGLVYLTEHGITERIEEADPAWSFDIKSVQWRQSAGEGGKQVYTVVVTAALTICGTTRDNTGMAIAQATNMIKGEYSNEANEAEKAATTDALKRCARLFGIGRYLLHCKAQNHNQLAQWLKQPQTRGKVPTVGNNTSKPQSQPQQQQSAHADNSQHWTTSRRDELLAQVDKMIKKYSLGHADGNAIVNSCKKELRASEYATLEDYLKALDDLCVMSHAAYTNQYPVKQ